MNTNSLTAISPIDGRYASKTEALKSYFSEYALIKYRVQVEVEYFIKLSNANLKEFSPLTPTQVDAVQSILNSFSEADAEAIKQYERITNHDVKAVEYFIKEKLDSLSLSHLKEWVHFGLTSQDINNTALPLMVKGSLNEVVYPLLDQVLNLIKDMAQRYQDVAMLAKTHGQAASPTTVGKECQVYVERIESQLSLMKSLPIKAKFGGATGNFNAHKVSFPNTNWISFADGFIESLGLERMTFTTQIAHYDHLGALFHNLSRINTILIDFAKDFWSYIMMDYFKQKTIANEVGSSAMPHKVNPIDFENAEGNLMFANAILIFLAEKLPVSRLQRDLTDSTVSRNVGVPFAHVVIACYSLIKGIGKLELNEESIAKDLNDNWAVVAEAIQNILRREGIPNPYEQLKALTRGKDGITQNSMNEFIQALDIEASLKNELLSITPSNYIGYTIKDY